MTFHMTEEESAWPDIPAADEAVTIGTETAEAEHQDRCRARKHDLAVDLTARIRANRRSLTKDFNRQVWNDIGVEVIETLRGKGYRVTVVEVEPLSDHSDMQLHVEWGPKEETEPAAAAS